jgi:outer membrane lipoprotein-sorting protein
MRRFLAFGALAGLAVFALAQVRGSEALISFAKALHGAKSVSSTYTVQRIGDTALTYKVDLVKPNKARIETPTQLIVSDGTTLTTYDKGDKTYYKKPLAEADLKAVFATDDLSLFGAFFDPDYYKGVVSSKSGGQKVRRSVTYNVVMNTMDAKGNKTVTLYLDPADKLAKVAEIELNDPGANVKNTYIVMTKDLTVDGSPAAGLFAFAPPEGSRQITEEELAAGRWYTDLDEAAAVAKKMNRPLFVDFYADW